MKGARQRKIAQVIRHQPVTSQNELVKLLRAAGYDATQATVSRDLEDLGAIKARREGKVAYALPEQGPPPPAGESLRKIFEESVLELKTGGPVLVIKTPPGHAGMVASALDRTQTDGIEGTVAGDDTILVVLGHGVVASRIEKKLRGLIEGVTPIRSARAGGGAA